MVSSSNTPRWTRSTGCRHTCPNGRPRKSRDCRASAAGWWATSGYEIIRYIERRLEGIGGRSLDVPDLDLLVCDEVAIFDNLRGSLRLVVHTDPTTSPRAYDAARERLDALAERLATETLLPGPTGHSANPNGEVEFESSLTREHYEDAVRRIQRYIVDGEAMQVVMSRCLSAPLASPPLDLYRVVAPAQPLSLHVFPGPSANCTWSAPRPRCWCAWKVTW